MLLQIVRSAITRIYLKPGRSKRLLSPNALMFTFLNLCAIYPTSVLGFSQAKVQSFITKSKALGFNNLNPVPASPQLLLLGD